MKGKKIYIMIGMLMVIKLISWRTALVVPIRDNFSPL